MPLAPHPERSRKQSDGETEDSGPRVETGHIVVQDPSGPEQRSLRQMVRLLLWEHNKQILNLFEVVCLTDEQWSRTRKQLLDRMNEQERSITTQVTNILGGKGTE